MMSPTHSLAGSPTCADVAAVASALPWLAVACRIGLVSKLLARGEVLEEALRIADNLASGSQLAIRLTKRALNSWLPPRFVLLTTNGRATV
ncbi:MAG TPA: hypothetical protein VMU94_16090, partial [Streptosporangiaceae bacterium]|nr:hypothetical protein [Streptosporangiaceae bacterium]